MAAYARIDNGTVCEIVNTELDIRALYHPSLQFVACPPETEIGDLYADDVFSPPPGPSADQLASTAIVQRDELLRTAAIRIAPLQDAVDIGEATAAEEQQLLAWKKYRVALNRITEQPGFPTAIEWPDVPSV